jgi:hypothetical protein
MASLSQSLAIAAVSCAVLLRGSPRLRRLPAVFDQQPNY